MNIGFWLEVRRPYLDEVLFRGEEYGGRKLDIRLYLSLFDNPRTGRKGELHTRPDLVQGLLRETLSGPESWEVYQLAAGISDPDPF